jgi:hypothetical protein
VIEELFSEQRLSMMQEWASPSIYFCLIFYFVFLVRNASSPVV